MNIPGNLKYTKEHEWVLIENGIATVGVTDYAQSQLGEIVFVDVTTEGETLEAGEIFGAIEAVKTVADAFMPLSGEELELNPELEGAPQLVNEDPYGKGWIIRIKMTNLDEANELLDSEAYAKLM